MTVPGLNVGAGDGAKVDVILLLTVIPSYPIEAR